MTKNAAPNISRYQKIAINEPVFRMYLRRFARSLQIYRRCKLFQIRLKIIDSIRYLFLLFSMKKRSLVSERDYESMLGLTNEFSRLNFNDGTDSSIHSFQ